MLFTAPAFMFVFLPLSLIFCVVFGKTRKKLCLAVVSAAFHVLFNMGALYNALWLPLIIVYSYFAARLSAVRKGKIVRVLLGCVPLVWLMLVRQIAYIGEYSHPVGITLPAICAASYIWDAAKGENEKISFGGAWLYLTFFPVMIIGPFLKYSQFCALTDNDSMGITTARCASGMRLYALGFIKRIAVGAVLIEGYAKIFSYSWESPNFAIIVLMLVLVYFGAFFSLSGYYDMATGISRIYGIDVPEVRANPFCVATPCEYLDSLFGGIVAWAREYIINPVCSLISKPSAPVLGTLLSFLVMTVFVRSEAWALLLILPLVAFALAAVSLRLDKGYGSYKGGRAGLRVLFGVLTVLVLGAFWIFVTIGAQAPSFLEYFEDITSGNAEYQTDLILISFSGIKYAFVALLGVLLLLPRMSWVQRRYERAGERARAVLDYGTMVLLLLIFVFTIVFFLPQFPMYNDVPFGYIVV